METAKKLIKKLNKRHWAWLLLFFIILIGLISFLFVFLKTVTAEIKQLENVLSTPRRLGPVYARGIYISSWTASENDRLDKLIDLILRTELNAAVIDIKDSSGLIAYASEIPQAQKWGTREIRIKDLNILLKKFQNHGIYTIARIVVFRDPTLAEKRPDLALKNKRTGRVWQDNSGLAWVDPASEEVWEYNVTLAKEALNKGFEEVNFDYIRFPSDGRLQDIAYPVWNSAVPKRQAIQGFFKYQHKELNKVGRTSADLFGMTLWHSDTGYDMNIGQALIDAIPYFNYLCPMFYPSHFIDVFEDLGNPAEHPYEVISRSFEKANLFLKEVNKSPKIRPWLQAFDMGAEYKNPKMINLQKQAVIDGNGYGWLLWNAQNDYLAIEGALKK